MHAYYFFVDELAITNDSKEKRTEIQISNKKEGEEKCQLRLH